jgi:hypothetical protein
LSKLIYQPAIQYRSGSGYSSLLGPYDIPSTATDVADLVDVFNFQISDQGTSDGAPTHITQLVFNAGSNNTVADWATVIGGVTLFNARPMYVPFLISPA